MMLEQRYGGQHQEALNSHLELEPQAGNRESKLGMGYGFKTSKPTSNDGIP